MGTFLFETILLLRLRRLVRGFLFVPAMIASTGVLLAIAATWVDRSGLFEPLFEAVPFLDITVSGARAVLGTIAGAMMTVISLVYSLTLVVFTLAAGNIGPRLLETFTGNRVNQSTIGLLGATFLYSLLLLYAVGDDEVPRLAVAIAIALATLSFFQVVYFVHDTAKRVMVDNEIGRTQRSLRSAIDRLLDEEPAEKADDRDAVPDGEGRAVIARRSGYVTAVEAPPILHEATKKDGFVRVVARPGHFILASTPIAYLHDEGEHDKAKRIDEDVLHASILLADARAADGDILFNVHLSIEIALRALSPGINDPYTAISAIDQLSASLGMILQRGAPSSLVCDDDEKPRVWLELIEVGEIVGTALHPLRRVASGNVMMTLRLIAAVGRMALVTRSEHAYLLKTHLRLIATDANTAVRNRDDRREIAEALRHAHRNLARHPVRT